MSAREQMLTRIRAALRDAERDDTSPPDERRSTAVGPVPPDQRRPLRSPEELVERFAERVADYRATVRRCGADAVRETIAGALAELDGIEAVAVPAGLAAGWRPEQATYDGSAIGVAELERIDAVVTACRVVIAETGTIVLDHGPDQGPRRLTLVPDVHVCVVAAAQVVADVDDAFAVLRPAGAADPALTPPLTFVSGPSATSDIELQRVEGVHGPRSLIVVLVDDAPPAA